MHLTRKIFTWGVGAFSNVKTGLSKLSRRFYKEQHQLTSVTCDNRYPELFAESVKASPQRQNSPILSFGCSTGEECIAIKKSFPHSKIIGVDINKANLKKAVRSNQDNDIKYLLSTAENIKQEGPYDIIFCLSVLCRWDDTNHLENCEKVYPFVKYNSTIEMLASQLNRGGLMVIYNSNFRFEDTPIFRDFEIVDTPTILNSGFVNKFNVNNQSITDIHRHCIYRRKLV
jgi:Methyltransferase domain